jgi:excisionase family DNA binding protein
MDEAAELLRVDRSVVEEASRAGQLPTVRHGDRLLIDGPQLLTCFHRAAPTEATDAS